MTNKTLNDLSTSDCADDCKNCDMPENAKVICKLLEQARDEIAKVPREERWNKFQMLAASATIQAALITLAITEHVDDAADLWFSSFNGVLSNLPMSVRVEVRSRQSDPSVEALRLAPTSSTRH